MVVYGCHDIPGFEDAKSIGTGLADWGRKDPGKLAFEHINEFLAGHGHGHGAGHEDEHGQADQSQGNHGAESSSEQAAEAVVESGRDSNF